MERSDGEGMGEEGSGGKGREMEKRRERRRGKGKRGGREEGGERGGQEGEAFPQIKIYDYTPDNSLLVFRCNSISISHRC